MPTLEHNALVEMFRENANLAPHLLTTLFHLSVPPYESVRAVESSLDQLIPVEFRADLVLELHNSEGAVVLAIVLEVQRDEDPDKKYSWPVYVSVVRARKRADTVVMVVAPDADVAGWAAENIDLGLDRANVEPIVLGPSVVPAITDARTAESEVELAILSALVHGNGPHGLAVVQVALAALGRLDQEHAAVYFQIVYDALREPMRRALEALVMERQSQGKATFPPFAQQLIDRGKTEGRAEGRSEGRSEGRAEGRAEEASRSVLTALRVRGIPVSEAARERIMAERDPARLERWLERAIVAASLAEVLDQ